MNNQPKANERPIKELFIGKCWKYLDSNFSKFTEPNKIKIALELCKKDIPQEMRGSFVVNEMPLIQKSTGEAQPINLNFNIGTPNNDIALTQDTGHTEQASPPD